MLQKKRPHKAWAMLFGCCLIQGGSLGLIHNCRGIFYDPVISDLGFGMGAFSFYVLFFGVCSCLVLPFVGHTFEKVDERLLLGGASLVFSGSVFVMGFFHTLPAFYMAGAFQGFSGAFLMFYPAPFILGNWFEKKTGLAVGISAALSGIMGVIGNPLGNRVIERFGWRTGFFVFGAVALLMMMPVSVFLLRTRPERLGLLPYGRDTSDGETQSDGLINLQTYASGGVTATEAKKSSSFWLLILAGLLAAMTCAYYAHLSPLGIYFGYGSEIGALLISCSMAGNVISKIVLGHLYDRFGLKVSLTTGTLVTLAGFILLLVDTVAVRLPAAFLYGFSMAMSAIMIAIAVKDVYGSRAYGELLSYSSMAATLGTSLNMCIIGFLVDLFGKQRGYTVSLFEGIFLTVMMGGLFIISVRGGRRLAGR